MKKAFLTLLLTTATLLSAWAGKPSQLARLARQYKHLDGFEMVSIGPLGTALLKGTVRSAANKKDREALKVFSDIKRLLVVDFSDIQADKKATFSAKVEKILSGMDLIMEAKDDGEIVRIYGVEKGDSVQDCIIYSSDGDLVVTQGSISLNRLGDLIAATQ